MSEKLKCPDCGAELHSDAPSGMCVPCALKKVLQSGATTSPDNSVQSTIHLSLPPTEKPGDKIGNYKLQEQIGEGGCGVVYLAEQKEPIRRKVALKVIKLGMDTKQVVARFEAERQALALMDHPNIAKVLDAGATETGRPFFVMELVRGIKITDYCDKHQLSTEDRLKLFVQVCHAIQHAHQKGIIHRDIKPSNILVTLHDGVPVPKVIDFGIAKATTGQPLSDKTIFTAFEQFIGTPAYMSPEQAEMSGLDIDTRTDVYALGVLLYELLTGKTPFDAKALFAKGLDEVRRIIREEEPPRPSTRLSTLDAGEQTTLSKLRQSEPPKLLGIIRGDLDWIVMKTLEKDRTRRYETANGLAMDIQRYVNAEPVTARPPSHLYKFQKLVRRNKLVAVASTIVATAILLGLGMATWGYFREKAARIRLFDSQTEQTRLRREAQLAQQSAQMESERAKVAAQEARNILSASDFRQAARLIDEGKRSDALTFLSRSLTANRTNRAALTRLVTLMTYNGWMVPSAVIGGDADRLEDKPDSKATRFTKAIVTEGAPVSCFSPDGAKIVIAWSNRLGMRDAHTGRLLWSRQISNCGIDSVSFSADSRRLLTCLSLTDDAKPNKSAIQVWDANTGEALTELLNNTDNILEGRLSSNGDFVLEFSETTGNRIWTTQTSKLLPIDPQLGVPVGFSPDSNGVLTILDRKVRLLDLKTFVSKLEFPAISGNLHDAEFSSDGQLILIADDSSISVWDARTGQRLSKIEVYTLQAHFNESGNTITGILPPQEVRTWNARTGAAIGLGAHCGKRIANACASPDGVKVLIAAYDTASAQVWDVQSGKVFTDSLKHGAVVDSARFSPDGTSIVTSSRDGITKIWSLVGTPPSDLVIKTSSTNDNFDTALFSPDGRRLLTASGINKDGRLLEFGYAQIWDSEQATAFTPTMKHDGGLRFTEFSRDGRKVLTLAPAVGARVWDAGSGLPLTGWLKGGDWTHEAHFSPDGKTVVTAYYHKIDQESRAIAAAQLWTAIDGNPLFKPLTNCFSANFSPDGEHLVTASSTNVCIRSIKNQNCVLTLAQQYPSVVFFGDRGSSQRRPAPESSMYDSVKFNPDGRSVLGIKGHTAKIWDASSGVVRVSFGDTGDNWIKAQFSPDGKKIVTIVGENTARVWDTATGKPLTEPLVHGDFIMNAKFSPDGSQVAIASFDKTARVWGAESMLPLSDPMIHTGKVRSIDFSPDGKRIATTSGNELRVWDLAPVEMEFPNWVLQLAEAFSGQFLNDQGVLTPSSMDRGKMINEIRNKLATNSANDDWSVWGRWLLAHPANRTASPFSKVISK